MKEWLICRNSGGFQNNNQRRNSGWAFHSHRSTPGSVHILRRTPHKHIVNSRMGRIPEERASDSIAEGNDQPERTTSPDPAQRLLRN